MNYNDSQLENMLMGLEVSQIKKIRDEYQREHPQERTFIAMCECAIGRKKDQQRRKEFAELIQKVKNESAPSGVGSTEQGNETRKAN